MRPIYRSHALWTTLIGAIISILLVPIAYFELTGIVILNIGLVPVPSFSSTLQLVVTYILAIALPVVVLWAWIDRSIEVALDMDFLHRDPLSWEGGLRWVTWAVLLAEEAVGLFIPMNEQSLGVIYYAVFTVIFAYAASVLFVSSRNVRDNAMKSYIRWVGVMTACLVASTFTYPYFGIFVIFAYALYRASGSFTKTTPLETASIVG